MNIPLIELEEGTLCVNPNQILYVQCRPMTEEEDSKGWYEHKIWLVGREAPLISMSQKWFSEEVAEHIRYQNATAYESDEYSVQSSLVKICESLQVVENLAISQMPREEPPMPPRQSPLDDDGA